ncbi:two-component system, OmpR family, sensor kinase [Nakamurella panacisegetis]|uniref:histidine kinase n=1 Tax=Nakamurella panacisegetis TaxID=1090615 RepID=A0A1H0IF35_9ACTN|nr:HAMP domain-containing sensor histidine kinase [Nakamurella panacisegetis]SDO29681.1 two-component system, OmpR family, sensor kinase [Nakamurella panacisegetis]
MSAPVPVRARWGLRARLILLVVAVSAIGLVAVDVVLPLSVRASLLTDRDATLTSAVKAIVVSGRTSTNALTQAASSTPLSGEVGWSIVSAGGIAKVILPPTRDRTGNPAIGSEPPTNEPATVGDADGGPTRYRIFAAQGTDGLGNTAYLVAWVGLDDVSGTVRSLILLELLVSIGLLVLLGFIASLIIRRELKPLEIMANTADDIADGDLDRRVTPGDPSTEIGRLGTAFNGMLDGIGGLLDEQQRNEARLRQFVADASHELRTPVAAVRGYSELYKAGMLPDEAAVARAMDRMGFEARRMGGLVEDLLTLIKADAEQPREHEPVDLAQLLVGVVDDAAVIDSSRTWRLVGATRPTVVVGDRLRLHQLFANLLSNVRTHTPPGTTATVSVLPGHDEVAVTVTDDGPGVSPEALPRLFDRFFREDESRSRENGGSGLGLSIVAAIVRSHGGRILAANAPGGGLTMTVVLPRPVGTAAVAGMPADAPVGVTTGPIDLSQLNPSRADGAAPAHERPAAGDHHGAPAPPTPVPTAET